MNIKKTALEYVAHFPCGCVSGILRLQYSFIKSNVLECRSIFKPNTFVFGDQNVRIQSECKRHGHE
jgi:hypothetical protein